MNFFTAEKTHCKFILKRFKSQNEKYEFRVAYKVKNNVSSSPESSKT